MSPTGRHATRDLAQSVALTRYRLLFALGALLYPLFGFVMIAGAPDTTTFFAGRLGISAMAIAGLASTYLSAWIRRHVERVFVGLAFILCMHALSMVDGNHLHPSYVITYLLAIFAVTISIETQKLMLLFLIGATAPIAMVEPAAVGGVPKWIFLSTGVTFGIVAIIANADRIRLLRTLGDREAYIRAVIDSIPGFVSWVDQDLRYLGVNRTLAKACNLEPEDFVGKPLGFLNSAGNDQMIGLVKEAFAAETSTLTREVTIQQRHGEAAFIMSCSKYRDGREAVVVGIDVTERRLQDEIIRSQQAQLVQSSKLSMLGEMSGGVAHEINNPLAVIVGYTQRLRAQLAQDVLDPKEVDRFSGRVLVMADRIAKIVQGLRTFAREASSDPFERVNLMTIVQDTLELCLERYTHHGVDLQIKPGMEKVFLDCRQVEISQVLLNLLNNAFDAVSPLGQRWIVVDCETHADSVRIRVTDSGPGIKSEVAAKMLQPFFTTKPLGQGTGLGLSISKGIVEAHGGTLTYDASHGHTRFVVELPLQQAGSQVA